MTGLVNRMSKYDIKQKEIYDIISANSGLSPKSVESVYKYLREVIIKELTNNGKIRLEGIGTFSTIEYGGKDIPLNFSPTKEKRYVEKYFKITFKPSDILTDCVNNKPVNARHRKKLKTNKKYEKRFLTNHTEEYQEPFDDAFSKHLEMVNEKKERAKQRQEERKNEQTSKSE